MNLLGRNATAPRQQIESYSFSQQKPSSGTANGSDFFDWFKTLALLHVPFDSDR